MDTNKYNPQAIRDAFNFLVDEFGYSITLDEELNYAFTIHYEGNGRRIILNHDYKDNFLYFTIIRGTDTKYDESDRENIRSFWGLFKGFEPELKLETLQPVGQTCAEAASVNAQLLKKYATPILCGEDWI